MRTGRYVAGMITARRNVRIALLATALGMGLASLSAPVAAGEGVTSTIEVVADGLNAPRGILYDADQHRVLVAEAGVRVLDDGTLPCGAAERGLPFCLTHTGSVFQFSESGAPSQRIVTGLPSAGLQIASLPVVIGVHDLTMRPGDDKLTAVFGTLGNKAYRESLGAGATLLGQAVTINGSGRIKPFADLLSFINVLYPGMEADPYGVVVGPYGTMVANAGGHVENGVSKGNDLLLVSPNGTISEVAQFPARPPAADPTALINTVPTSVAQGPDGAFYVGELSGAPFYPGEARVWRVVPGQSPQVYAQGFTSIVDLIFDEQGRLIVLQTGADPFDTSLDGALIRIEPDGQRTVLASAGVRNPGGVAMAGPGVFYVSTMLASGGGVGQLLRITVDG